MCRSDVYIFCLLAHRDKATVDPLNLDQWHFFVLPRKVLDERNRHAAAVTPLAVTGSGGVEGVYAAPHLGFEASLQLRLEPLGTADVLIGLGWGSAGPGGGGPGAGRSGAALRRAREALAALREASGRARRPAGWRTNFAGDDPTLDDAFAVWLRDREVVPLDPGWRGLLDAR